MKCIKKHAVGGANLNYADTAAEKHKKHVGGTNLNYADTAAESVEPGESLPRGNKTGFSM